MNANSKKVILSHSGKQHSYQVAKALLDLGMLEKFFTSAYITSPGLQKLLIKNGDLFWSRRFMNGLAGEFVQSNWRFEMKELLYARLFGNTALAQKAIYQRDSRFDRYMCRQIPKLKGDIYWGFQGSCYSSLQVAKKYGKITCYDFPSAHYNFGKAILEEERSLHPAWKDSFAQLGLNSRYEERLLKEPELADHIFTASSFARMTIEKAGISSRKIHLLPLGVDFSKIAFNAKQREGPLKLLYVGRVSQAKGIVYLLEAMKSLPRQEVMLTVLGIVHGNGQGLKAYSDVCTLKPAMSQSKLFQVYQEYDALVLPSLFEGFGLVIIEAMAAGLPVITTPHTMGPDVIVDDQNGYIVPIRDVAALEKAIGKLADKDSEGFHTIRLNARKAAMEFTWDKYRESLKDFLETMNRD